MDAPFTVRTCSILCLLIILEMMLKFNICRSGCVFDVISIITLLFL